MAISFPIDEKRDFKEKLITKIEKCNNLEELQLLKVKLELINMIYKIKPSYLAFIK